jgi:GNAT superfamily N-acetyltransferase
VSDQSDVGGVSPYIVRLALPGEEAEICDVCMAGFAASSAGLLPPATIQRQGQTYYNPERVRREIDTAHDRPEWQGYVVAASHDGRILGAAGGGVTDGGRGNLYVIYLRPALRGHGIGTALLNFVTDQQRAAGATEQWVSVTEGNHQGIPFYLARGFTVHDRVPYVVTDDGSRVYSLRMSRPIPVPL